MSGQPRVTAYAHAVHATGGMERAQREVVLGLLRRDWRVRVVAREAELPPHEHLEVVRVHVPARPAPLEQLAFAGRAPRFAPAPDELVTSLGAIVAWPVDVVIVQYVNASARGMRAAGGSGGSLVRRLNNRVNDEIATGLERWCYRPGRAERFLPVSDRLRDDLAAVSGWCAARSLVVPNGVDPEEFAPDAQARARTRATHAIAPDVPLAVFVGGDWERKGLRPAIEALALAPDWHLLVIGRGEPQPYRADAVRLGCGERLHFAGESRSPAQLLAGGDAFVLPTRYEGFPLSAIEAASVGLALLLTSEANADGLLHEGETGFRVQRDAASIAARLNNELADPSLRARMGASSRRVAAGFSWAEVVDRHVEVYSEILAARSAPSRRSWPAAEHAAAASAAVVIATRDRPDDLARCLAALQQQAGFVPEEIIVVDDGSTPPVCAEALDGPIPVRVLRTSGIGPATARNAGVRAASADVILFTDDDTVPAPGWAAAAMRHLREHPEAVAVEGPVTSPAYDALHAYSVHTDAPGHYWTCNIGYRRAVLEHLGGFAEDVFPYAHCEDRDLAFRALALGPIGFSADMSIVHTPRAAGVMDFIRRGRWVASELELARRHPAHMPRGGLPFALPRPVEVSIGHARNWQRHWRRERAVLVRSPRRLARFVTIAAGHTGMVAFTAIAQHLRRRGRPGSRR